LNPGFRERLVHTFDMRQSMGAAVAKLNIESEV
jgi:hypothetical protein